MIKCIKCKMIDFFSKYYNSTKHVLCSLIILLSKLISNSILNHEMQFNTSIRVSLGGSNVPATKPISVIATPENNI